MRALLVFSILLALTLSCATGYKQKGLTGGYSELQLDENVFKVVFKGNGYTSKERAADFALLRSAEVALEHGFEYFVIVESDDYTSKSAFTTPSRSSTNATVYPQGYGANVRSTTTTYGGNTYVIAKPSATNLIVCFSERPQGVLGTLKAAVVANSIREKYHIR